MHEMPTIATDYPDVCQSVFSLSVTRAQMTKWNSVLFRVETTENPDTILDWVPITHSEGWGVRCGLCQITLVTC